MSKFSIGQYYKQLSDRPGVAAGMWYVEETKTKTIAYFDTREQALAMKEKLERMNKAKP